MPRLRLMFATVSAIALSLLSACQPDPLGPPGSGPKPTPMPAEPRVAPGPDYGIASDSAADFGPDTGKQYACWDGTIETKSEFLGGLSPKVPIAVCHRSYPIPRESLEDGKPSVPEPSPQSSPSAQPTPLPEHPLMPRSSILLGAVGHRVYLVKTPEGIKVLGSVEQVRDFYAPIESPAEALSYLLAVTDAITLLNNANLPDPGEAFLYDGRWDFMQGAVYRVSHLEPTRVEAQGDGFVVRNILRDSVCLPNGMDIVASSADYRVSRKGEIQDLQSTQIFSFGPCPIE